MDRGISQRFTECLVFVACPCLGSLRTPYCSWSGPEGTGHNLAQSVDFCREVPSFTEAVQSVVLITQARLARKRLTLESE